MPGARPIDEYKISGTIKIAVWPQKDAASEPTFSIEKLFWDKKLSTYRSSKVVFMNELMLIMVGCAKVLARYNFAELEQGMAQIERIYRVTREGANALSIMPNAPETPLNRKNRLGEV